MKKYILFIIIAYIVIFPTATYAVEIRPECPNYDEETKTCTISLCMDGCDGLDLASGVFHQDVNTLIINLKNDTYTLYEDFMAFRVENVIINGNDSTLTYSENIDKDIVFIMSGSNIQLNDLNIDFSMEFYTHDYTEFNNIHFLSERNNPSLCLTDLLKCKINNSVIKGLYAKSEVQEMIEINNSDIRSSNHCSINYIRQYFETSNHSSSKASFLNSVGESTNPSFLPNNLDYDVVIKNSKLNCASINSEDGFTSSMYIDSTNEWEDNRIDRGDEGNVTEKGQGYIYIETSNNDLVEVNTEDDLSLANYFDNIININNVVWEVEDETIARIENNKIIPLRAGTTNIYGTEGRNFYKLAFTVREDVVEPTPTPTSTPVVEPTPNATIKPTEPVKEEDVKVPNTYAFSLIMILFAIILSIFFTYRLIIKEEE